MIDTSKKELKLIDKAAREFAQKALLPTREESDRYPFESFPYETLEKAFDVDFFHMTLPEGLGGIGRKITPLCIVLQTLCETDASIGSIIFTHSFSQELFLESGDTGTLERITSEANDAVGLLIAYPVFSRPDETEAMVTAEQKGGKYLLTGTIDNLVLGGIAKQCLIPGKISGQKQSSMFFLNLEAQGCQLSEPVMNMGIHACPCVDLTLNHAEAVLVGQEEKAGEYF